jgi:hypothetical protein
MLGLYVNGDLVLISNEHSVLVAYLDEYAPGAVRAEIYPLDPRLVAAITPALAC